MEMSLVDRGLFKGVVYKHSFEVTDKIKEKNLNELSLSHNIYITMGANNAIIIKSQL